MRNCPVLRSDAFYIESAVEPRKLPCSLYFYEVEEVERRNPLSPLRCWRLLWSSAYDFGQNRTMVLATRFFREKACVIRAVAMNGMALEFADATLKRDRSVVLKALEQTGMALQFVDSSLQKDEKVVFTALKQNKHALRHATELHLSKNDRVAPRREAHHPNKRLASTHDRPHFLLRGLFRCSSRHIGKKQERPRLSFLTKVWPDLSRSESD